MLLLLTKDTSEVFISSHQVPASQSGFFRGAAWLDLWALSVGESQLPSSVVPPSAPTSGIASCQLLTLLKCDRLHFAPSEVSETLEAPYLLFLETWSSPDLYF